MVGCNDAMMLSKSIRPPNRKGQVSLPHPAPSHYLPKKPATFFAAQLEKPTSAINAAAATTAVVAEETDRPSRIPLKSMMKLLS
ncbi:MAG: hypothetical protein [Inoviridae sp.]|nr:MAG: hypothetical protein [Inoviridae sp.]